MCIATLLSEHQAVVEQHKELLLEPGEGGSGWGMEVTVCTILDLASLMQIEGALLVFAFHCALPRMFLLP